MMRGAKRKPDDQVSDAALRMQERIAFLDWMRGEFTKDLANVAAFSAWASEPPQAPEMPYGPGQAEAERYHAAQRLVDAP